MNLVNFDTLFLNKPNLSHRSDQILCILSPCVTVIFLGVYRLSTGWVMPRTRAEDDSWPRKKSVKV